MKTIRPALYHSLMALLIGFSSIMFFSCGTESPAPEYKQLSISGFINQDPNFKVFAEGMRRAGLEDSLENQGPFTLLLSSDQAFEQRGILAGEDLSPEEWRRIILYHLSPGDQSRDSLSGAVQPSLLSGYYWLINEENGRLTVNGKVNLMSADLILANGRIHILDGLLDPQRLNLVSMMKNAGYTTLAEGIETAGLSGQLADFEKNFTILAPTNEAFQAYFDAQKISITDWLAISDLSNLLNYMIRDGEYSQADFSTGSLLMNSQDSLYISSFQENTWMNGTTQISRGDITGGNGLIHEIDHVLAAPQQSLATLVSEGGDGSGYSEFKAALIYADLLSLLEAEEVYTVFAPDNAAFLAWYQELEVSGYYEVEKDLLRETLMHHIALGRKFTTDFDTLTEWRSLLPGYPLVPAADGGTINGIILDPNYQNKLATNGLIHGIKGVLPLQIQE